MYMRNQYETEKKANTNIGLQDSVPRKHQHEEMTILDSVLVHVYA